jgi:mono/diheme cytochrome c family protein
MLKGIVTGIILTLIVGAGAGYAVLASGVIPANADAEPGALEQWIAGTSLQATLNAQAPTQANPIALTDANLIEGVRLYGQNCAICHGSAEGGTSASWIAKGEYPAPPQLASDGVEDDPEGWTFWKIKHGIRLTGMPSWSEPLNDNQIWTLALFLKHMDKLPPAVEKEWKAVPAPAPGPTAASGGAPK